jgi:hypothetical protein
MFDLSLCTTTALLICFLMVLARLSKVHLQSLEYIDRTLEPLWPLGARPSMGARRVNNGNNEVCCCFIAALSFQRLQSVRKVSSCGDDAAFGVLPDLVTSCVTCHG